MTFPKVLWVDWVQIKIFVVAKGLLQVAVLSIFFLLCFSTQNLFICIYCSLVLYGYLYLLTAISDNTNDTSFKIIHTAVGHVGGVKDICFIPSTSTDSLEGFFFSCGSRTTLKCWKLKYHLFSPYVTKSISLNKSSKTLTETTVKKNRVDLNYGFSCSLLTEIYNPEMTLKKLKLKNPSLIDDMRYMKCTVFTLTEVYKDKLLEDVLICVSACSDGVARYVGFTSS